MLKKMKLKMNKERRKRNRLKDALKTITLNCM